MRIKPILAFSVALAISAPFAIGQISGLNLSQLPGATSVADSDLFLVWQAGTTRSMSRGMAIPPADSATQGRVELATSAEVTTGTDTARAITPNALEAGFDGSSAITTVGTLTGGDATGIVSAATDSLAGKVELATNAEVTGGTDTERAVTPSGLENGFNGSAQITTVGTVTSGTWSANLAADTVDAIGEIASGLKSGTDATLITGTAGTNTWVPQWNSGGDLVEGYRVVGLRTLPLPASAWSPSSNSTATDYGLTTITAFRPELHSLIFSDNANESAETDLFAMPKGWNEGTVDLVVSWTTSATDADGVAFSAYGVCYGDGDTYDEPYPSIATVTDNAQSVAWDTYITANVTLTLKNAAESDWCIIKIFRDHDDAADTLVEDVHFLGAKLLYTRNVLTDD